MLKSIHILGRKIDLELEYGPHYSVKLGQDAVTYWPERNGVSYAGYAGYKEDACNSVEDFIYLVEDRVAHLTRAMKLFDQEELSKNEDRLLIKEIIE